jgi:hypothetical protein
LAQQKGIYSFASVAVTLLMQASGPNCGSWAYLSLASSIAQKFHFLQGQGFRGAFSFQQGFRPKLRMQK